MVKNNHEKLEHGKKKVERIMCGKCTEVNDSIAGLLLSKRPFSLEISRSHDIWNTNPMFQRHLYLFAVQAVIFIFALRISHSKVFKIRKRNGEYIMRAFRPGTTEENAPNASAIAHVWWSSVQSKFSQEKKPQIIIIMVRLYKHD